MMREVVPFWTASLIGILFGAASGAEARHISLAHHLHHFSSSVLLLSANVIAFAVLWVAKFIVFNRLFHITPEAEAEIESREDVEAEIQEDVGAEAEGEE